MSRPSSDPRKNKLTENILTSPTFDNTEEEVIRSESSYLTASSICMYDRCVKRNYCGGFIVCGKFKRRTDALLSLAFVLMLTALMLSVIGPLILYDLVDQTVNEQVVIDSTSAVNYNAWQTNAYGDGAEVKIHYDLFYFHVHNPDEIVKGAKPQVTEVGPYAFREYFYKFDIEWSDDGDTVTYNTQKYYVFDESRTGPGLTLNDSLTLPYVTPLAFQYLINTLDTENITAILDAYFLDHMDDYYVQIQTDLQVIYGIVNNLPSITGRRKEALEQEIVLIENQVDMFYKNLNEFVNASNPVDLIYKLLMCHSPHGVSPFWSVKPSEAWFGWLNDPVLVEVQKLLDVVTAKSPNNTVIPWTSAVPGSTINYTTVDETRRRRAPDTLKTGKKNVNQVSQYVRYSNMSSVWCCVNAMSSQNASLYKEGKEFPSCTVFQHDWTNEEAIAAGYQQPFATPYANRIEGTDANMYGRPVVTDKVQIFISDIYRSAFIKANGYTKWGSLDVKRFELQVKDMYNSTLNPENLQYYNYDGPTGMENLTSATAAPVWLSFPHFLNGDDKLVGAISGLIPNYERHNSYLDVEPQTGLLARAEKRLQVNYLLENQAFPTSPADTVAQSEMICSNISKLVDMLMESRVPLPLNLSHLTCEKTAVLEPLLSCFATNSDWTYQDNRIFFPVGWADEAFELPTSDAEELNDSLIAIDDLATQTQFWCLVISGILFAMISAMLLHDYLRELDQEDEFQEENKNIDGYSFLGGFENNSVGKALANQQRRKHPSDSTNGSSNNTAPDETLGMHPTHSDVPTHDFKGTLAATEPLLPRSHSDTPWGHTSTNSIGSATRSSNGSSRNSTGSSNGISNSSRNKPPLVKMGTGSFST